MVRIYFDTPTFDRIIEDERAKFEDMLSTIGGEGKERNSFSTGKVKKPLVANRCVFSCFETFISFH